MVEAEIGVHLVEKRGCDDAGGCDVGHLFPESVQPLPCPFAAAEGQAIGKHDGIDAAGARCRDTVKGYAFVLKQAIEHTPREGAVAASALKRQVDGLYPCNGLALLNFRGLGMRGHGFPLKYPLRRKSAAFPESANVPSANSLHHRLVASEGRQKSDAAAYRSVVIWTSTTLFSTKLGWGSEITALLTQFADQLGFLAERSRT